MFFRRSYTLVLVFIITLVSHCGKDDTYMLLKEKLENGWNKLTPGGNTTCSRGGKYFFYARPGTVNKVVVDFEGGGACWNSLTCSPLVGAFQDSLPDRSSEDYQGIYDYENPDNPFKDWYHIFVSYCTGDVHWGDKVKDYGSFSVRHKGKTNASAALNWVYDNFENPERIFITGCSAGAYGSIGWAPYIINHYPNAEAVQFGDSGVGVTPAGFFEILDDAWNTEIIMVPFIPVLSTITAPDLTISLFYKSIGEHFGSSMFSQFTTTYDETQALFYEIMGGGDVTEWSSLMNAIITDISNDRSNFRYYVAPGTDHCILPYDAFYDLEVDGVKLRDWIDALANGDVVENVQTGD